MRKDYRMLPYLLVLNLLIIVFGGGGRGCAGRGCLFWIVLSVVLSVGLTILVNLILFLVSGGASSGVNV